MKIGITILLSLVLLASQQVFAHSDHTPITEAKAAALAADIATQLSKKDLGLDIGKLVANWALVPKESIIIATKGRGYYIVAVENKREEKTLYVLMSSGGDVYDANFSGTFKGIE
ncbi:DUF6488 family protein [Dasania marina]|uniref:DUF6488 family protein n=1 Tax=Dasania marina TaxID=471499 RepID=UPI0030D807A5|tara:strand:+ start:8258 stop:8602 length:345 start_codon:yes stop_codon:yes gene_type:complete